jgi:hypothetical protein
MIKILNKTILLLLPILLAFSCKKEEERRLGDGTISFYMNGELWQNSEIGKHSGGIKSKSYNFFGNDEEGFRTIKGIIWDESCIYIGLSVKKNNHYFPLGNGKNITSYYYDDFKENKMTLKLDNHIYISKKGFGYVEYTKHTINSIGHIEGVFEATLYNKDDPSDIIEVTDGRFNN